MQLDKFQQAKELRREIVEIESALTSLDKDQPFVALEKLSVATKAAVISKSTDVIKRELKRIIIQKEKEFTDL